MLLYERTVQTVFIIKDDGAGMTAIVGYVLKVNASITFNKRVPLHNLEVEIRQGLRCLFINNQCQPETQAGNLYGTFLYVHAIDIVLNNFPLDLCCISDFFQYTPAEKYLFQHAHGECTGAYSRVADLHLFKTVVNVVFNGSYTIHIPCLNEMADSLLLRFVFVVGLQIGNKTFAAHIMYHFFRRIICTLILVVFQQILKDAAEHLRVDTDLSIIGIVLIYCKVVLTEEF